MTTILTEGLATIGECKGILHSANSKKGSKDSDNDEEIKSIFNQITKLSGAKDITSAEFEDVEAILKKAEDLAKETHNVIRGNEYTLANDNFGELEVEKTNKIPEIKVTNAYETEMATVVSKAVDNKVNCSTKYNNKETSNEVRRRTKIRPFSASVIDSRRKETAKATKYVTASQKKVYCKQDSLIEELKDTNERAKSLEIVNVQLTDDNRILSKKLDSVIDQKQTLEIKLNECEKFISRLGKEYENRKAEVNAIKESEIRITAELNKERNERKNLSIQHEKDKNVIQDLQRQCKEMELILRRKHPDSVSPLIVASKSSTVEDNKKKLLEERLARLELELKDKDEHFQSILLTLQEKFSDMKNKYENHIIDVERQLMDDRKLNTELKNKLGKLNLVDSASQTVVRNQHSIGSQINIPRITQRSSSAFSRISQNSTFVLNKLKEDSYLVATIKGLQAELTMKQRTITKIKRETDELRKNLRNLQKEKEVLLNLNPRKKEMNKQTKSAENILARVNTEMEAELTELRMHKDVLMQERNTLLDSLKRTNEEFILLKKKRIQDLHTLQLAHEKELMQMNMQLYPLQEEIQLLNKTIEILQERVRSADDKLLRYQAIIKDQDMHGTNDKSSAVKNGVKRSVDVR